MRNVLKLQRELQHFMSYGRSFHSFGAIDAKALSPYDVRVLEVAGVPSWEKSLNREIWINELSKTHLILFSASGDTADFREATTNIVVKTCTFIVVKTCTFIVVKTCKFIVVKTCTFIVVKHAHFLNL